MLLEVNSASSPIFQAVSISRVTPEVRLPHSRDPSVLPTTTHWSSHFVVRISREAPSHIPGVQPHSFVIRSIVLEFDRDSCLHSSFQTVKM